MSKKVTVAVVAIGGYGSGYVGTLLTPKYRRLAKIVAGIDPTPERCAHLGELKKLKVPIYPTMEKFYAKARRAPDLVIISSPIQLHAAHAISALEHGSHVLCEKPMCATVQDAEALREARDRSGKFVIIGYQRSFTPGAKALHRDVRHGLFGAPKRLRTLCLVPRAKEYYGRNNWAGMQKSPDLSPGLGAGGRWVLDSPANNAVAHFLHAMFHTLGGRKNSSALPVEVTAELYRANDIANFDTCAIRAITAAGPSGRRSASGSRGRGVEVLFLASHAVDEKEPCLFRWEFEKAVAESQPDGGTLVRMKNGRELHYGGLGGKHIDGKLSEALRLARAGRTDVTCGIEAAYAQTLCINGAQDSMPRIASLKKLRKPVGKGEKRIWVVPGLAETLRECWKKGKLPSELAVPWAKAGKTIDLTDYRRFPGGR